MPVLDSHRVVVLDIKGCFPYFDTWIIPHFQKKKKAHLLHNGNVPELRKVLGSVVRQRFPTTKADEPSPCLQKHRPLACGKKYMIPEREILKYFGENA